MNDFKMSDLDSFANYNILGKPLAGKTSTQWLEVYRELPEKAARCKRAQDVKGLTLGKRLLYESVLTP